MSQHMRGGPMGRGFLTEEEKANRPRVTGALLRRVFSYLMPYKGRLTLETPIKSGDEEITELIYDFTALNGMEYTDAMDSDPNATGNYRITYRQALSLFAKAAAKQTDRLDMQDIVSQIGVTDAVEGVQLATLFFNASTRAGRLRISKR